jgi:hypothetical protein
MARYQWFESGFLQQRVSCELDIEQIGQSESYFVRSIRIARQQAVPWR